MGEGSVDVAFTSRSSVVSQYLFERKNRSSQSAF